MCPGCDRSVLFQKGRSNCKARGLISAQGTHPGAQLTFTDVGGHQAPRSSQTPAAGDPGR